MEETTPSTEPDGTEKREVATCPFCQTGVFETDESESCGECRTLYHADCWKENDGCAIYGCTNSAETIKWSDNQIPVSYWGKETKACPSCSQEIVSSALRCKHCGTVFKSAKPTDSDEFGSDRSYEKRKKELKRKATFVFVANAIPILSVLGLLVGGIWTLKNRALIRKLPSINRTLCYLGLTVGVAQILLIAALAFLYTLTNSGN